MQLGIGGSGARRAVGSMRAGACAGYQQGARVHEPAPLLAAVADQLLPAHRRLLAVISTWRWRSRRASFAVFAQSGIFCMVFDAGHDWATVGIAGIEAGCFRTWGMIAIHATPGGWRRGRSAMLVVALPCMG